MLKIKDDVDLKELGKFGFKEYEHGYVFNKSKYDISLNVYKSDRKVIIFSGQYDDYENGKNVEPKLYDLIQAGLVEKVER